MEVTGSVDKLRTPSSTSVAASPPSAGEPPPLYGCWGGVCTTERDRPLPLPSRDGVLVDGRVVISPTAGDTLALPLLPLPSWRRPASSDSVMQAMP